MKKLAIGTLVLVALAAVIAGPAVFDAYRLQQYIESSAKDNEANGGPWPRLSDACVACHGVEGNSANQHYPSLAGQPSVYLVAQLRNFNGGQRVFPIMNAMARSLTEKEVGWLADYFSHQGARENRYFEADENLVEKGQRVVATGNCGACHGETLMGQAQFPRLAGQGYDYLLKQMNAFADGTRVDPTRAMNQLASSWTADDRQSIATFLASRKPVSSGPRS